LLQAARELRHDPLHWALSGGEDYGLLFVAPADAAEELARLVAAASGPVISRVGRITAGSSVVLVSNGRRQDIAYQGYDHFSGPTSP
jgi:thiamine-monophosphate kinase